MGSSTLSPPAWLTLADSEQVWVRTAPSRNLVLAALATGFVLLLVMSVTVSAMDDLQTGRAVSFTVLLLIVGLLVVAFLITKRNEYVLTSDRVCTGVGLRSKRVTAVAVRDVQDVTVEQSTWQQLVNVGTVRFVAGGDDLRFSLVGNPVYLQQQVFQFVDITD
ncbi:PH domain-containing protein [Haloferax sp. S1W]|uniref:PH domain-containing protein n=1 Tax=Haloferax sp. S1W TaxID=3377110 RepID=UPI0037C55C35